MGSSKCSKTLLRAQAPHPFQSGRSITMTMADIQGQPDEFTHDISSIHLSPSQRRRVQSEQAQKRPESSSSSTKQARRRSPRIRFSQPNEASLWSWAEATPPVTPFPRQTLKRSSRAQASTGAGMDSGTAKAAEHTPIVESGPDARTTVPHPQTSPSASIQGREAPKGWVPYIYDQQMHPQGRVETADTDKAAETSVAFAAT